jgi:hypothetical protein
LRHFSTFARKRLPKLSRQGVDDILNHSIIRRECARIVTVWVNFEGLARKLERSVTEKGEDEAPEVLAFLQTFEDEIVNPASHKEAVFLFNVGFVLFNHQNRVFIENKLCAYFRRITFVS